MKLLSMKLTNFKGIRDLTLDFPDGGNYNIYGTNGAGKTTIVDALIWLLFDKDSTDVKDFSIKTVVDGEELHRAEHSVECMFLMETGRQVTMRKEFREKWQKPRGQKDEVFTGHTTNYYIDGVPKSQTAYKNEINRIIDEKRFKVLTNPLYFNEKLNYSERRTILLDIIGGVKQDDVIAANLSALKDLKPLLKGRSVEDYKLIIKQSLAKTRKELDAIEPAIRENQNMMISGADVADQGRYENKVKECTEAIETLIRQIAEVKAGTVNTELEKKKAELNQEIWQIKDADAKNNSELRKMLLRNKEAAQQYRLEIENKIYGWDKIIREAEGRIASCTSRREEFLKEFNKIQGSQFNSKPIQTVCPMCGQTLPAENVDAAKEAQEKMLAEFNRKKAESLKNINEHGKSNNLMKAKIEKDLEAARNERNDLEELLKSARMNEKACEENITNFVPIVSPDIEALEKQLAALTDQTGQPDQAAKQQIEKLEAQRQAMIATQKEAQDRLNEIEQNRKHQDRIRELQEKETELSTTFTKLKKQEFLCDQYSRCLTNYIDHKVGEHFKLARFVMFKDNISNEGVKECCEVQLHGTPYHDLCQTEQMHVGLDIIQTLCKYYNLTMPVLIDRSESFITLPETDMQIIRLIVSADDKKLRVEKA